MRTYMVTFGITMDDCDEVNYVTYDILAENRKALDKKLEELSGKIGEGCYAHVSSIDGDEEYDPSNDDGKDEEWIVEDIECPNCKGVAKFSHPKNNTFGCLYCPKCDREY